MAFTVYKSREDISLPFRFHTISGFFNLQFRFAFTKGLSISPEINKSIVSGKRNLLILVALSMPYSSLSLTDHNETAELYSMLPWILIKCVSNYALIGQVSIPAD